MAVEPPINFNFFQTRKNYWDQTSPEFDIYVIWESIEYCVLKILGASFYVTLIGSFF
jgi:hypothetical protein